MKTVSTENLIAHLHRIERNLAEPGHLGAAKVARFYLREAKNSPPTLMQLARKAQGIYRNARKDLGRNLGGYGLVDLLADNLEGGTVPLKTIDHVIVLAGLAREREWINQQRKLGR